MYWYRSTFLLAALAATTDTAASFKASNHEDHEQQTVASRKTPTTAQLRSKDSNYAFVPSKTRLEDAMMKLNKAFDLKQSDFLEHLVAQEETTMTTGRLDKFVPHEISLSVEHDLDHFRRSLMEQQSTNGLRPDVSLTLLKRTIDKLHEALNEHEDKDDVSYARHLMVSRSMTEAAIIDLAIAVEGGDSQDMEAFLESHSALVTSVLKSHIAKIHQALIESDEHDQEVAGKNVIQRLLQTNDPAIAAGVDSGLTESFLAQLLGSDEVSPLGEDADPLQVFVCIALLFGFFLTFIVFPYITFPAYKYLCEVYLGEYDNLKECLADFFNPSNLCGLE